jgi:hypothetical protein
MHRLGQAPRKGPLLTLRASPQRRREPVFVECENSVMPNLPIGTTPMALTLPELSILERVRPALRRREKRQRGSWAMQAPNRAGGKLNTSETVALETLPPCRRPAAALPCCELVPEDTFRPVQILLDNSPSQEQAPVCSGSIDLFYRYKAINVKNALRVRRRSRKVRERCSSI